MYVCVCVPVSREPQYIRIIVCLGSRITLCRVVRCFSGLIGIIVYANYHQRLPKASIRQADGRLTARSPEVSKSRDLVLDF